MHICLAASTSSASSHDLCTPATYPLGDPLHHAPSILEALRRRQTVRSNLASGTFVCHEVHLPGGLASADCRQHAVSKEHGEDLHLHVRDLPSGASLHRWPLPRKRGVAGPKDWRWGRRALAMPYCCSQGAPEAGVLLIDPSTGSCACVSLVPPGPVQSIKLSRWSATDRLLAEVHAWEGNDEITTVHVLTDHGQLVSRIDMPVTPGPYSEPARLSLDSLALNGKSAVLHPPSENSCFCIWHIDSSELEQHEGEECLWIWQVTWSFDSSRLLLLGYCDWEPYNESAAIWSQAGLQTSCMPADVQQPLWGRGPHVAMLGLHEEAKDDIEGGVQDTVHFFSVTAAGELRPVSVASLENVIVCDSTVALAMSPDGYFLAACTGSPRYGVHNLAVFSMDGQLLHETALSIPADSLQWSADSATLLVSDTCRGDRVLIEYS